MILFVDTSNIYIFPISCLNQVMESLWAYLYICLLKKRPISIFQVKQHFLKIHLSCNLFLSNQSLIASQLTKNLLLYCWSRYRYSSSFYEKNQGREYLYNMYQDISMLNVKPLYIHLGLNYWLYNPSQLPKLPPTISRKCLEEFHAEFLAE